MKKRVKPHNNQERWMVSYADFMTLLFAFFVVLYSSSQVDKTKMASLSDAITAGFQELGVGAGSGGSRVVIPGATPTPLVPPAHSAESVEAIRHKLENGLAEDLDRRTVSLRETSEGLILSLREVGFFESGSATLRASSLETFDRIGAVLASVKSNLRIEGHTDNVPIHTVQFQSNWELSSARATEVIQLLLMREGIDPQRLSAAGYAEFHPVADNSTEDGRRLNRRVDIVIISPHDISFAPPAMVPASSHAPPVPSHEPQPLKEASGLAD